MPGYYAGKTVPIKVTIGIRPNGHADHPDWSKLPLAIAGDDPTNHMAGGWVYDKVSGHNESTPDSPRGQQFGMLFVSEQFANEAVATFPTTIVKVTSEADVRTFVETRATAHMPEYNMDVDQLTALKLELDLAEAAGKPPPVINEIKIRIDKALDPDDATPGKRKQKGKAWADIKAERGIDLSDEVS